jgi:hypothetical protein
MLLFLGINYRRKVDVHFYSAFVLLALPSLLRREGYSPFGLLALSAPGLHRMGYDKDGQSVIPRGLVLDVTPMKNDAPVGVHN